jgi:hypothetical protein
MNNSTETGLEPPVSPSVLTRGVQSLWWLFTTVATYFAAFVGLSVTMVYFKQEGMLYHPCVPSEKYRYPKNMPAGYRNPMENGMEYKDVWITTKDKVKLHAWFVKANPNPRLCRTLIFFHGNAGNIGSRLPNIEILVKQLKTNVLILAYRGYGDSEGKPSEEGLKLDAEATLEYALEDDEIDNDRIFIFGRSLGASVGARLGSYKSNYLKGIILENGFTSIADMVDHLMPLVARFKFLIQRLFYPTLKYVKEITCPILIVRGVKDEIVPSFHGTDLYNAAAKAKFR